jgi:SOS response regulatory protein OraA/RecX
VPTDARSHAQQVRFLAARGFGAEVIAKVLRGNVQADATEPDDTDPRPLRSRAST